MPMSKSQPMTSEEDIVRSLTERAVAMWGEERVRALKATIETTAEHIWQISQDPPPSDEEPAFYF